MFLKRIEISGFMSFADRTVFEFGPGLTGLVGSNGGGKSSVVDAFKWVLGTQSPKSLRSNQMQDVIFHGSQTRKRSGLADVLVVFDNSRGLFKVDHDEVSIRRKLYRSGESEYYINDQVCQLRNIRELLSGTGLGTSAYSIIEQGKANLLISSDGTERRRVLDEAAGIALYKKRKRDALNRLERIEHSLQRIKDALDRDKSDYRRATRQAKRAETVIEIEKQLKARQTLLMLAEYEKRARELAELRLDKGKLEAREAELASRLEQAENRKVELEERKRNRETTVSELRTYVADGNERIIRLDSNGKMASTRADDLSRQAEMFERMSEESRRDLNALRDKLADVEGAREGLTAAAEADEKSLEDAVSALQSARTRRHEVEEDLRRCREVLYEQHAAQTRVANRLARAQAEAQWLEERLERHRKGISACRERIEELRGEQAAGETRLADLEQRSGELARRHAVAKGEADTLHARLEDLKKTLSELQASLGTVSSRLELFRQWEARLEGLSAGPRSLLLGENAETGSFRKESILGVAADVLQVPQQYERAIETALAGAAEWLLVRSAEEAVAAVELLSRSETGQAGFLPLEELKPKAADASAVLGMDGIVGRAVDLVQFDEEHRVAFEYLLSEVVVARDLESAKKAAETDCGRELTFATLRGDVVCGRGHISGGGRAGSASALISRKNEISRLSEKAAELERRVAECKAERDAMAARHSGKASEAEEIAEEVSGLSGSIADSRGTLNACMKNIERERDVLETARGELEMAELDREEIESQLSGLLEEKRAAETRTRELETAASSVETDLAVVDEEIKRWEQQAAGLRERSYASAKALEDNRNAGNLCTERTAAREKELAEWTRSAEAGRRSSAEQRKLADEAAAVVESAQTELAQAKQKLQSIRNQAARIEQELANESESLKQIASDQKRALDELTDSRVEETKLASETDALETRARDLFDISLEQELSRHGGSVDIPPETREEIDGLTKKRERMGEVNRGAIIEKKRLEEKLESMENNYQDLITARDDLKKLVARVNRISRDKFRETLKAVRENFQNLFVKLFGGGSADLVIADGEDVLEAPIEILAQPPGKKECRLSQFSGGEKGLTAAALHLAIFQAKPGPFCILDETDAPLSDRNVDRFMLAVQEFSQETQFLLITHKKQSMRYCPRLYGVTTAGDGVSHKISVALEELEVA